MKRGLLKAIAAAICLLMVVSCASVLAEEKTTVTFQTWNPADSGPESPIYQIIEAFEAENPDIHVDYVYVGSGSHQDQLCVKLMGGEGSDVFGISAGATSRRSCPPTARRPGARIGGIPSNNHWNCT